MNKSEWLAVAEALAEKRLAAESAWPPKNGCNMAAPDIHDRKLIRAATLAAIDEIARSVCAVLRARSSRFDGARFLRIVGVERKRQ